MRSRGNVPADRARWRAAGSKGKGVDEIRASSKEVNSGLRASGNVLSTASDPCSSEKSHAKVGIRPLRTLGVWVFLVLGRQLVLPVTGGSSKGWYCMNEWGRRRWIIEPKEWLLYSSGV
jgi:hypothetical protein